MSEPMTPPEQADPPPRRMPGGLFVLLSLLATAIFLGALPWFIEYLLRTVEVPTPAQTPPRSENAAEEIGEAFQEMAAQYRSARADNPDAPVTTARMLTLTEDTEALMAAGGGNLDTLALPGHGVVPPDPYGPPGAPLAAYARAGGGWAGLSAGPDGDYDYRSAEETPEPLFFYDPTNGVVSSGDLIFPLD
ncbi:MAG: hypothetical protein RLY93_18725 [Sumerlaeia bacterium]